KIYKKDDINMNTIYNENINKDITFTDHRDQEKISNSTFGFINNDDFLEMYGTDTYQMAFTPDSNQTIDELSGFSNSDFLNTIPSYSAEQLSLNMIIVFLYVISGMLFAIFFYVINVQKLVTY